MAESAGTSRAGPTPRSSLADRRWVIGWALVLLLLALAGLGGAPLFDVDEGAFSEATREMLASGDWGHTTLNGEPRWDKPMFSYWMQSLSVAAFGLHEAALRLPSALASWGWALALLLFAAPRWGRASGIAAAGLLASALGVVLIGRAATADALLNLWLTLATLDLWRHLEADGAPAGRAPLRRAALWMALGLLTKGPVAVLIPGAAVGLWLLTGPLHEIGPRLRALLGDAPAWAILLGLGLPWYGYAYLTYGREFIDGFILKHNLQRYGGTLEGHSGSLFYYVGVLPLLLLPWTPLALAVLRRAMGIWRQDRLGRFLLGWAGFVLVFFSFSGTKLPHYVLYGISPIALLAGRVLARWLGDEGRIGDGHASGGPVRPRAVTGLILLAGLWPWLGVAIAVVVQQRAAGIADAYYRTMLMPDGAGLGPLITAAALASVGLLGVAVIARWQRGPAGWPAPTLAAALLAVVLPQVLGALPWWGERLQGAVKASAAVARPILASDGLPSAQPGQPLRGVVQWGLDQPSFALYLERPVPRRAPQPGELALARRDRIEGLVRERLLAEAASAGRSLTPAETDAAGRSAWQLLHEQRGLVLLRWQGVAAVATSAAFTEKTP